MTRRSAREVGAAVQACIDRFYHNANPAVSVVETLDTLRRIGWPPDDVWRVERISRKVLGVPLSGNRGKAA